MKKRKLGYIKLPTILCIVTIVLLIYSCYIYCIYTTDSFHQQITIEISSKHLENEVIIKKTQLVQQQLDTELNKNQEKIIDLSEDSLNRTDVTNQIKESTKNSFPNAIEFTTKYKSDTKNSVLVVGGTDGSGTRRVVQILTKLGIIMVSEDPETYDIHADNVGGWPQVVKPVITSMKTLNYNPNDLPNHIKANTKYEINKILHQVELDSTKPTSYKLAVGGVLPHPIDVQSNTVIYGFKAPIAMTLIPCFAEENNHFKFLHVVRDGRDISFSANQGPVNKFYTDMYGNNKEVLSLSSVVKGMKLWSDWNSQIHDWAKAYTTTIDEQQQQQAQQSKTSKSFGYFVLHAEDLVSDSISVRYAAVYQLASFVGSTITSEQLCCLVLEQTSFMGSHDRMEVKKQNTNAQLHSRYGKWKIKLAQNIQLSNEIHSIGTKGLQVFGYEPMRSLADSTMSSGVVGYQCLDSSRSKCTFSIDKEEKHNSNIPTNVKNTHIINRKHVKPSIILDDYSAQSQCNVVKDIDYAGGDISSFATNVENPGQCCIKCKEMPQCQMFTVDLIFSICYLKTDNIQIKNKLNLISGTIK